MSVVDPATHLNVDVTLDVLVPCQIGDVFDFVAAEDVLPKILTGYGLVPGVASTSNVSGPWDRPGSTRVVHLLDGSTVNEGVTHYDRPTYFAYRVSEPTFSLKYFMSYARGQFWFAPTESGTQVKWTYSFRVKNAVAKFPLMLFANMQWKGYVDVCLRNVLKHFAAS
jgi:Polyketide cyclase / dehydrase and lipid transport